MHLALINISPPSLVCFHKQKGLIEFLNHVLMKTKIASWLPYKPLGSSDHLKTKLLFMLISYVVSLNSWT
jgi:hypothetical protein